MGREAGSGISGVEAQVAEILSVPPNFKKPMVLRMNALEVGIGATLSREDEEGNVRLIACRSKKTSSEEKNYIVQEKEMSTLMEWRHYLLGADVRVSIDNSALTYLHKSPKPSLGR